MIKAVKMAVEEINAAGGVHGKDVVLVGAGRRHRRRRREHRRPTTCSPTTSTSSSGAAGSTVALAVIDKITGAGIPMCSPSNTGVQFTTVDDNGGFYFRTAPPDNLQAQVLADLIVGDGHENVVVAAQSTEYGEGFANFLADELEAAGATVPPTRSSTTPRPASYQAEAAADRRRRARRRRDHRATTRAPR